MSFYLETALRQKNQQKIQTESFKQFYNLPFWIWNREQHANKYDSWLTKSYTDSRGAKKPCCFNHAIGLPIKNGITHSIYPWQKEIHDVLWDSKRNTPNQKMIATLKGRGVGFTEYILRYILWRILKDDSMQNMNVAIVTGIRENLSLELLSRFRNLLPDYNWKTSDSSNIAEIKNCNVVAYPEKRVKDLRGLTNCKIVFSDETAHADSTDLRALFPVLEAFLIKSNAQIILGSTPAGSFDNKFYDLFQEPEQTCRYRRIFIPIQKAKGLISKEEAAIARTSANYLTEFELHWQSYDVNSLFTAADIDTAAFMGRQYAKDPNYLRNALTYGQSVIGYDPSGGGTTSFHGVTMLTLWDSKVHVTYAKQFSPVDYDDDFLVDLIVNKLWLNATRQQANLYLDAAQPSMLRRIKSAIRVHDQTEDPNFERVLEFSRKHGFLQDYRQIGTQMVACPVPFNVWGSALLSTLVTLFQRQQFVFLESSFSELSSQLKIAHTRPHASKPYTLDKSQNYLDLIDSTILACFPFMESTTDTNQSQYSGNEIL